MNQGQGEKYKYVIRKLTDKNYTIFLGGQADFSDVNKKYYRIMMVLIFILFWKSHLSPLPHDGGKGGIKSQPKISTRDLQRQVIAQTCQTEK